MLFLVVDVGFGLEHLQVLFVLFGSFFSILSVLVFFGFMCRAFWVRRPPSNLAAHGVLEGYCPFGEAPGHCPLPWLVERGYPLWSGLKRSQQDRLVSVRCIEGNCFISWSKEKPTGTQHLESSPIWTRTHTHTHTMGFAGRFSEGFRLRWSYPLSSLVLLGTFYISFPMFGCLAPGGLVA